jgi:hypothetical protein
MAWKLPGRLIDPSCVERDVKLLAFGATALFGILKLAFSPITPEWVQAFYALCALTGIGGSAWALVDKMKGSSDANKQTTTKGTMDEGGTA